MKRRRPKTGEVYRHFKGKRYRVMHIALCAETNEEMVVYEALQGEGKVYVSTVEAFLRETNRKRYPDAEQEYRFELCEREPAREHREKTEVSEETLIMEFLELDENEDRAEFLMKNRGQLTDRFLTVAAESLEFAESAETVEERWAALMRFLKTKMKYESRRLR